MKIISQKNCEVKNCLLDNREQEISNYIDNEITALTQRLEDKNPDVHPGCLHMIVKTHLEYESIKIFHGLAEKYNPIEKEVGVA